MRTHNSQIGSLVVNGSILTPEQMAALRAQLPEEDRYNIRFVVCCLGDRLVLDETIAEMSGLMDYVAARRVKGLPLVSNPGLINHDRDGQLDVVEDYPEINPGDKIVRLSDGKSGVVAAASEAYVHVLYNKAESKIRVRRKSITAANYTVIAQ